MLTTLLWTILLSGSLTFARPSDFVPLVPASTQLSSPWPTASAGYPTNTVPTTTTPSSTVETSTTPSILTGPAGNTIYIHGTPVVAGLPAAVIQGTTYSLAPAGTVVIVNGTPAPMGGESETGKESIPAPTQASSTSLGMESTSSWESTVITTTTSEQHSSAPPMKTTEQHLLPSTTSSTTPAYTMPSHIAPGSVPHSGSSRTTGHFGGALAICGLLVVLSS